MNGYKIKFNGIDRLYKVYKNELSRAAEEVWQEGKILLGKKLKNLENRIAKKYKRTYAVGVGSATDGIYFALRSLGLSKNNLIFCPVLSYVATAGAIKRLGCKPYFLDVDKNGNIGEINYNKIPNAIVYVNLFGNVADYTRIKEYCNKNKVLLIEDAAQSQGAVYKDILSGKMGDVSIFSFDPMKNMPSFGSGGMVLTDSKEVYENLLSLRRHGIYNQNFDYGYNSVIPEDHAAQLNILLEHYDEMQKDRERVANRYFKNLSNINFIKSDIQNKSSYHKLIILVEDRDNLKKYLNDNSIETKIHYNEILDKTKKGYYKIAENFCLKSLSLPIYPFLLNEEIDYICERINKFYGI